MSAKRLLRFFSMYYEMRHFAYAKRKEITKSHQFDNFIYLEPIFRVYVCMYQNSSGFSTDACVFQNWIYNKIQPMKTNHVIRSNRRITSILHKVRRITMFSVPCVRFTAQCSHSVSLLIFFPSVERIRIQALGTISGICTVLCVNAYEMWWSRQLFYDISIYFIFHIHHKISHALKTVLCAIYIFIYLSWLTIDHIVNWINLRNPLIWPRDTTTNTDVVIPSTEFQKSRRESTNAANHHIAIHLFWFTTSHEYTVSA